MGKSKNNNIYNILKCIDDNCEFIKFIDASNKKGNCYFRHCTIEDFLAKTPYEHVSGFVINRYEWLSLGRIFNIRFGEVHMALKQAYIEGRL